AYCCPRRAGRGKRVRGVEYWAARGAMDIGGLGERIAAQLVHAGLVHNVADLCFLKKEDLMGLEGFGEKKAEKLIKAIDESRTRPLTRILPALGIPVVGTSVAALVLHRSPQLHR